VGTARYLAPEILRGRSPDERSDLFAAGVLLHECLRDGGPQYLRWLADLLVNERPENRPGSAAEALELLDRRTTGTTAVLPSRSTFHARRRASVSLARSRRFRAIELRPTRSALAVGAIVFVLIALLIVLVANGSGGGGRARPAPALAAPAANAGLNTQLEYLDQVVARARR
jgi:serine/threonine-protein kinase